MSYKIFITEYAKGQMKMIIDYITYNLLNPTAANKLADNIIDRIDKLTQYPRIYPVVEKETIQGYETRRIIIGSFYVYYWILEEQKEIYVSAVTYGKRDQCKQLLKMKKT